MEPDIWKGHKDYEELEIRAKNDEANKSKPKQKIDSKSVFLLKKLKDNSKNRKRKD